MITLGPFAQHHAVFIQRVSHTNGLALPVLYLQTKTGPDLMTSLVYFFLAHPTKSKSWMRTYARAVGLFWDYCVSTDGFSFWRDKNIHRNIVRYYALSLLKGTIEVGKHSDVTGLYWPPSSFKTVKNLLSALNYFIYWCHDEGIAKSPITRNIRPFDEESVLSCLHQARFIKKVSFLSHLKHVNSISNNINMLRRESFVNFGNNPASGFETERAISFPEELLSPFLQHGFVINKNGKKPEEYEDITAKMIVLLLFFGGTRKSEPLHLWYNDVVPSLNGGCKIFLRHPSESLTYLFGNDKLTRRAYLTALKMTPRNEGIKKSYHAGWKNLNVDKSFNSPIYFCHLGIEYLFSEMYLYYLRYRDSLLMYRRNRGIPDHPFLFVSSGIDYHTGKDYRGEPYSRAAFDKAWERALKRTEKAMNIPIPRGKYNGTTPHAGRHFYGRALSTNGVDKKVIQLCMRHRSFLSQDIYTTPSTKYIDSELNKAKSLLSSNFVLPKQN